MQKLSNLWVAIAFAAAAGATHAVEIDAKALPTKRFAIHTEVTKGGKVVSSGTKEIENGGKVQFTDAIFKEIDTSVTVTCLSGWQRWVQFYKPRCTKPVREIESVPIGFNAEVGAREVNEGQILLYVRGHYVDVIKEYTLKGVEADMRTASFRESTLNTNVVVKAGEVVEVSNGHQVDEIRLKLTITAI